mmetsp:Transcript_48319/g.102768  ORF Transcript_48319/g.102768 Transcript_48319/m.102768 type:complete len:265 (+) Transcript_48319:1141-1935(+)
MPSFCVRYDSSFPMNLNSPVSSSTRRRDVGSMGVFESASWGTSSALNAAGEASSSSRLDSSLTQSARDTWNPAVPKPPASSASAVVTASQICDNSSSSSMPASRGGSSSIASGTTSSSSSSPLSVSSSLQTSSTFPQLNPPLTLRCAAAMTPPPLFAAPLLGFFSALFSPTLPPPLLALPPPPLLVLLPPLLLLTPPSWRPLLYFLQSALASLHALSFSPKTRNDFEASATCRIREGSAGGWYGAIVFETPEPDMVVSVGAGCA